MKKRRAANYPDYFLFILYLTFFVSIVFSFRAISSILIGLILITGIIKTRKEHNFTVKKSFLFFLLGCCSLFIIQCLALVYTNNISEGAMLVQRSSGMVFIPFAVWSSSSLLKAERFRKLTSYLALILCIGCLYCLTASAHDYFFGAPFFTFFYHDLVKPLSQHAIQFSIMIFITLAFLIENLKEKDRFLPVFLVRTMIGFLSFFLVLLSSKLIISFYIFYLLFFFFYNRLYQTKSLIIVSAFVVTVVLVMLTPNPVGNRFRAIFKGNATLFEQEKFNPGIYFNGLQFRLLQWRFTYEILNEQHAWISGLTPGDAQSFLDKKYIETNMYTGIPGTEKHGFIGYHTHNQFLQSLLENGIPGVAAFLFIFYSLFNMAIENKGKVLKWLVMLLFIYCFTDAPLKTQYGIVIFTFLPAWFYFCNQKSIQSGCAKQATTFNLIETIQIKQPN